MLKRLVFAVLTVLILCGSAYAQAGQTILEDMAYGVVIGGILGSSVWLLNTDSSYAGSLGTGVAVGSIAGFLVGVAEVKGFVEIDDNSVKFAMPMPVIEVGPEGAVCRVSLLKARF